MVGMATMSLLTCNVFHFPNKSILSLPCLFSALTMYNKTIIGFGFCDMQNYQCLGKSYLPRLRLADNSYLDIDNSAYHKTSSNNCLIMKDTPVFPSFTVEFPFYFHEDLQ